MTSTSEAPIEQALADLVHAERPRLVRLAERVLGSRTDAEDAVQDALLAAYRSLAAFEGRSRLSTWVYRVTMNAALGIRRTRSRRPEVSLAPERAEALRSPSPDPERAFLASDDWRRVCRAMSALPGPVRETLADELEGRRCKACADAAGVTEGAVKLRRLRARRSLRRAVEA
ncbi:MAG: RNA polymerase sigma factor [Vicinamibacterales bacterium]